MHSSEQFIYFKKCTFMFLMRTLLAASPDSDFSADYSQVLANRLMVRGSCEFALQERPHTFPYMIDLECITLEIAVHRC
jgi:hypothetical protein